MFAFAATASQNEEAEERDVFKPWDGMIAVTAVRTTFRDTLADGPAGDADVHKAAEDEAEQRGKGCAEKANHR